jgi:hypothetical protein
VTPPVGTGGTGWYSNTIVQCVKDYVVARGCGKVWKTFRYGRGWRAAVPRRQTAGESRQKDPRNPLFVPTPARLCSNCAGDYEDPDRTAGPEDAPREWSGDDGAPWRGERGVRGGPAPVGPDADEFRGDGEEWLDA